MTTQRPTMDKTDEWANTFARRERRRNTAIGIGVFLAVALFTALIVAYFGGAAAMPW